MPQAEQKKAQLKIFLPSKGGVKESPLREAALGLPSEYGENMLLPMPVDPVTLFVSWEIIPRVLAAFRGEIVLRLYDVTGVDFTGLNAHRFVDFYLHDRVGDEFLRADMPGREAIAEIGILPPGGHFTPILRSRRFFFPAPVGPDELGIGQKLSDSGIPFGY